MSGDERNAPPPYSQYPPNPQQPPQPPQIPQTPGSYPGYPPASGDGNVPPSYPPPYPQYPPPPYGAPYPYPPGVPTAAYGQPQPGWEPNPQEATRYGRIGKVPWTLKQTIAGTAITIVPWLVIIFGVQILSAGTTTSTARAGRLPVAADLISGIVALIVTVIVEGAFLIAPLVVALGQRPPGTTVRDGLRAIGFRKAPLWPSVGWVVGGMVVVYLLGIVYQALIQVFNWGLQTNAQGLEQTAHYAPITTICTLIGAVFVAPFCEEIFFRGYLFAGLLRGVHVWLAALIATALFTLVHGDLGSAVLLFAIGLILAGMRYRLGSIWPGMVLHALNNGIAAIFILATIFGAKLPGS